MNDIHALQRETHRLSDRDVDFVGGPEGLRRILIEVDRLPPPLMATHFYRQGGFTRRIGDVSHRDPGPDHQSYQHDGRNADAHADPLGGMSFTQGRLIDRRRIWLSPSENADQNQGGDDHDDRNRDQQQTPHQGQNAVAHRPGRTEITRRRARGRGRPKRDARNGDRDGGERRAAHPHSPFGFWPLLNASVKLQGLVVCRYSAGTC